MNISPPTVPLTPQEQTAAKQLEVRLRDVNIRLQSQVSLPEVWRCSQTQAPVNLEQYQQDTSLYYQGLLNMLEHNQQCRANWVQGVIRGPAEQSHKIDIAPLLQQQRILLKLIRSAAETLENKDDFLQFVVARRRQLFDWHDYSPTSKLLVPLHLPLQPQYYELHPLLTESQYFRQLQQTQSSLWSMTVSSKHSAANTNNSTSTCSSSASSAYSSYNCELLFKYVLEFCSQQLRQLKQLISQITWLRTMVIRAVLRMYYLIANTDKDIDKMQQTLTALEEQLLATSPQHQHQGQSQHNIIQGQLGQVQQAISSLLKYLTDPKEAVFKMVAAKEQPKRLIRLLKLQSKLGHIDKLRCQPLYLQQQMVQFKKQQSLSTGYIAYEIRQIEQLRSHFGKPLEHQQFKTIYQAIQRTLILVNKQPKHRPYRQQLLQLHQQLIEESAQRTEQRQGFFQPNYTSILEVSLSPASGKQRKHSECLNKDEVLRQGMQYLAAIRTEYAQELADVWNFKVHLLPRIARHVQQVLLVIPFSEQPLNMQLTRLLEQLRLVPQLIRPEINMDNLEQLFVPHVNSELLSQLKQHLLAYHHQLTQFQQTSNTQTQSQLSLFLTRRIAYLQVLTEHLQKLEPIAAKVQEMYVPKEHYDIAEQGTYSLVLTLLLAHKELKAVQLCLYDLPSPRSPQALSFLTLKLIPLFLGSLSRLFLTNSCPSLESLLQLCQEGLEAMHQSYQCMDSAIHILQDLRNDTHQRQLSHLVQEIFDDLRALKQKLEQVAIQANRYSRLSASTINRQIIRVEEFMQICQKGTALTNQPVDERSIHFLALFKVLAT